MPPVDNNARSLLLALGMGDYNATGVIPYMFMAPAQLDSDMAASVLLVECLQRTLNQMGARLPLSGDLDVATAMEMQKVAGPMWLGMKWYEIVRRVVRAKHAGFRIKPGSRQPSQTALRVADEAEGEVQEIDDGMGWMPDLSSISTVGVLAGGAALLYFLFGKRGRHASRKGR